MANNGDSRLVIQKMGQLFIPPHFIEAIDLASLGQRINECCSQLDKTGLKIKEITEGGVLLKLWRGINGQTTQTLADAIRVQGEMAKEQFALLLLNTLLAKELNRQQEILNEQQSRIITQNKAIEAQNQELKQLSEKSLEQQQTIFNLHKLTDGQEKTIRALLDRAARIEELEQEYTAALKSVKDEMTEQFDHQGNELDALSQRIKTQEKVSAILDGQAGELRQVLDHRCSRFDEQLRDSESHVKSVESQIQNTQEILSRDIATLQQQFLKQEDRLALNDKKFLVYDRYIRKAWYCLAALGIALIVIVIWAALK